MSKQEKDLIFERTVPGAEAAALLDRITAGLRAGRLSLSIGEEAVVLEPGAVMELELAARRKKDKESLVLKLKWRKASPVVTEAPLEIVAGAAASEPGSNEEER